MTATTPAVPTRRPPVRRLTLALPARLLRLELHRNIAGWLLPLIVALFWLDGYHYAMGFPPFWGLRSPVLPDRAMVDFALFGAGASTWMGSRDVRRRTTDLLTVTAVPRWGRQFVTWAATTGWTMAAYLACVAVLYWSTARQGAWGGPPLWPVAVGAAGVAAACALGFAAGVFFPSRFTAPLATLTVFLLATAVKGGGTSTYGLISPVAPQGSFRPDSGVFYHYLPDLSIDQVLLLAGLAAAAVGLVTAGTAIGLAGTARLEPYGVVIPALHNAASDRPIPYTPVCGQAAIPVCLHPAYQAYLPAVTAALRPLLS